jgi:hypothetical protein
MKLPWTKRAEDAEQRVERADQQLHTVERQWVRVDLATGPAIHQRQLNGWTMSAKRLMGKSADR